MKIKTAFILSIVVNAVLFTAIAYIAFTEVPLRNDPIIVINRFTPSAPSDHTKSAPNTEPNIAALP